MSTEAFVDYVSEFPDAIIAQGQNSNFIRIVKLDQPFRRADGKKASYELEYRWLSTQCENENDQAWACVQGNEFTYWQAAEIKPLLAGLKAGKDVCVFDHFNLF
jgi:hypothetical protein